MEIIKRNLRSDMNLVINKTSLVKTFACFLHKGWLLVPLDGKLKVQNDLEY